MEFKQGFTLTSVSNPIPKTAAVDPFAPISIFLEPGKNIGNWEGKGFNQIWRPLFGTPGQDRFLELNETLETLGFDQIPGDIPNRGLLQPDINLHGLRYLQQIADANVLDANKKPSGIHVEPGIWLTVPPTTNPLDGPTLVRMGNIPHGTNFVAQGVAFPVINGAPTFQPVSITPFKIGQPSQLIQFPESTLTTVTNFRTPQKDRPNVTQAMVDNPNTVLADAIAGKKIVSTTTFHVSTIPAPPASPSSGGGEDNIAFLLGGAPGNAPNAQAAQIEAIFWIETEELPGGKQQTLLQYSQRVLLNFNGLSWPHVSVATLIKKP
ncbi:MAG TPA: heme-binding protein [Puia sp.]|jgi:hypothetical protein|nr:heme-binding protein [Puia sp.]